MNRSVNLSSVLVLALGYVGCTALIEVDARFDDEAEGDSNSLPTGGTAQTAGRDAGAGAIDSAGGSDVTGGGAGAGGGSVLPSGADGGVGPDGTSGAPSGGEAGGAAPGGEAGQGGQEEPPDCDEEDTRPCSEDDFLGSCAKGIEVCTDGAWGDCSVEAREADSCEPGNDDDCNGVPNEGCDCVAGTSRLCQNALGNCAKGSEICEDGSFSACEIEPADEDSCQIPGDDADCDGTPNGGCECNVGDTLACLGPDQGICDPGESTCVDGAWGPCEGTVNPQPRDCLSSEDNDCDGEPDNAPDDVCQCTPTETESCEDQAGGCRVGARTCVGNEVDGTVSSSAWGGCVYENAENGASCDDGNSQTADDTCTDGVCEGKWELVVTVTGTGTVTGPGIDCPGDCSELFENGRSVTLQARTQNGSGYYFQNWDDDCSGAFRDCTRTMRDNAEVQAIFQPMLYNLMFVSNTTVNSNLGGVAAYDTLCNAWATSAGINNSAGNAYVAWMSETGDTMVDRLASNLGGWVRLDGRPMARSRSTLFTKQILYPPNIDEFGNALNNVSIYAGTDSGGIKRAGTCEDWTTTSGNVDTGQSQGGPGFWTVRYLSSCGSMRHIYCFGKTQTTTVPAPSVPSGAKIAYRTEDSFPIGGGSPDAFCNANKPSAYSSRTFKAYISTTSQAAASAVDNSAEYYRPDGVYVGPGSALSTGANLEAGIWVTDTLSYPAGNQVVWTGSTSPASAGSSAQTCSNWSSTSGTGARAGLSTVSRSYFSAATIDCDEQRGLFCVQP